jgi:hypothetical protein
MILAMVPCHPLSVIRRNSGHHRTVRQSWSDDSQSAQYFGDPQGQLWVELSRSAAMIQWQHLALGATLARRSPHSHPRLTGTGAASARRWSRTGSAGGNGPRRTAGGGPLREQPLEHPPRHPHHSLILAISTPNPTACRSALRRASSVNDDWETGVIRTILLGGAIG